jgi:Mn2+/Fe2+ NRAMP family transporter
MVFNVIILVLPLAFLVRLTSDRDLLGDLANSRPRAALLWIVVVALLVSGVFGMFQYLA